ncbi:MAG TPA: hypothetical protein VFX85_02325 [Solirubrobacterales bacterium]|nr:hypothetical protein [Solirubrobacterales bacterium]
MRARRSISSLALTGLLLLLAAAPASAEFGFLPGSAGFEVRATTQDGELAEVAGSHPFALTTEVNFRLAPPTAEEPGTQFTDGDLRDLTIDLPPGLIENPSVVPRCTQGDFGTPRSSPFGATLSGENCPANTQIGTVEVRSSFAGGSTRTFGIFNLEPPPGFPSQIGASPFGSPMAITPRIRETGSEFGLTLELSNFTQRVDVYGVTLTIWGTPWSIAHDGERGNCLNGPDPGFPNSKCSVGPPNLFPRKAYLTLPTSCDGPLTFKASATSWQQPVTASSESASPRLDGCDSIFFDPAPVARLNTNRAGSMSGFDFTLNGDVDGLTEPRLRASSQVKKAVVKMPVGMTVNPSIGAGLGVCTPAQYAAETVSSPPGAGCPNASKIGELTVESPLIDGEIKGGLFLAQPDDPESPGAENPFDSLIALYLVAKAPERGVMVRLSGETVADPVSGQLTTTFDGLPQLPYSTFNVHFRDGQRTPLATPATCGVYTTEIGLSPWLEPAKVSTFDSLFELNAGIGGGPCPTGTPPFTPGAVNGMINRAAGAYTPFYLHLTRTDAEQEITSYSAKFPPGLLGKLKGIPYCPEAAITAAKRNTGVAEQRNPSCPEASKIGHTYSGYGLGSVLAYAPGNLYLAGPYGGSPFSIVAVNSALVGPFDLGVITVRSAIKVDRRTAEVSVDSSDSDPIPHILDGIPLHLRDIRVYIDRPNFMLNPTSCNPFAAVSSLTGSGPSFGSTADDVRVSVPSPFQVSSCSGLEFKPQMSFTLRGGNRRGQYPALQAEVRPRPGDANIGYASVLLPPSLFLAQENIQTICTRRQFDAKSCPPGSMYGQAKAITPLLGQPLEGPVYLRASDNLLPDLVADISGAGVRVEVGGKIDSVRGGMRATFTVLPDAPVTKFTMTLKGGKKGLLAISDNLCKFRPVVSSRMGGQNNVGTVVRSPMGVKCPKKANKGRGGRR